MTLNKLIDAAIVLASLASIGFGCWQISPACGMITLGGVSLSLVILSRLTGRVA